MNKDILKERIKKIEDSIEAQKKIIDQVMANLNMLEGGKQESLHWLKEIEESEKTGIN